MPGPGSETMDLCTEEQRNDASMKPVARWQCEHVAESICIHASMLFVRENGHATPWF